MLNIDVIYRSSKASLTFDFAWIHEIKKLSSRV